MPYCSLAALLLHLLPLLPLLVCLFAPDLAQ